MKKFSFNLTALLKLRKRYEERVKQEMADQKRRVEEQIQTLGKMKSARLKTEEKIRSMIQDEIDMAMEKSCNDYLQSVQRKINEGEEQLALLQEELERRRQLLIKASQDVSVLEKIKEQRFEIFKKELSREEQAFLDEIALTQKRIGSQQRRTS